MRLWEQQDNEGSAAYGLFRVYLDLGPDRTWQAVALQEGRSEKLCKRLYYKYKWISRAKAHDNYLARAELDAATKALQRDAVKRVQRYSELTEIEWELGQKLVAKARKMLAFPLTREKVVETAGPMIMNFEGEMVPTKQVTIIVEPAKFGFKDAKDFADTASKLMRMSIGKETERKVLGLDVLGDGESNLQSARDLYQRLCSEYADRPEVLEHIPQWLAEHFGFEPKQLEGTVEGEIVDDSLSSAAEQ